MIKIFKRSLSTNNFKPSIYLSNSEVNDLTYCPARLEHHYYESLLPDLLTLTYDHKHPEKLSEFNSKYSDIINLFGKPLKNLETLKLTTGNVFTSINCKQQNKFKRRNWQRAIYNPIDYTPINKKFLIEGDKSKGCKKENPDSKLFDSLVSKAPFISKIAVQIWTESAVNNKQLLFPAIMSISSITGKRAEPLFAKKGDSTKKIREGMPMGAKVDLTGKDMYEFLDKLKETVLPRLREWEGVHPSMGRDGSITISLPDHAVGYFPDIEPHFDMYPRLFDTDIKIFSNCANEKDLVLLLSGFGIPFSPKVYVKKTNENGKDPWARYRKKGSSTEVTIKKKK